MEIIENQGFILGPKVDRLERKWNDYTRLAHSGLFLAPTPCCLPL